MEGYFKSAKREKLSDTLLLKSKGNTKTTSEKQKSSSPRILAKRIGKSCSSQKEKKIRRNGKRRKW